MSRNSAPGRRGHRAFPFLVLLSAGAHAAVVLSLPDDPPVQPRKELARVVARVVQPPKPPPPPPPPPPPAPKPEPTPEAKAEPKAKPKAPKKKKARKKRRPPRTLVAKAETASASAPAAAVNVETDKQGLVTDLGDWDPDATDEEVEREFDPAATEEDDEPEVVEAKVKDRKAYCRKCRKPVFPLDATAVLPARVVLSVKVRANGTVSGVSVVREVEPLLDEAAKTALLASVFHPAIKNGRAVADRIPFTVEFK